MQKEATFTDKIHSLLSYTLAFEEKYDIRFDDVRILDIVEDMMSFNNLSAYSRATNICCIGVCKVKIEKQGVLSLLGKLGKDATAAKTVCITQLDDPSLYTSSKEYILLMNEAADAFVKSDHELALFHAT